jgi:hypothetical protein
MMRFNLICHLLAPWSPVAYPGIFAGGGGGATNSIGDRKQREWGSGDSSPLVRGSGGSCNLVQEIPVGTLRQFWLSFVKTYEFRGGLNTPNRTPQYATVDLCINTKIPYQTESSKYPQFFKCIQLFPTIKLDCTYPLWVVCMKNSPLSQ